MSAWNTALGT